MKTYRPILSWLIAGLAAGCLLLILHSLTEAAWGQPPMEQNSGALDDESYGEYRQESMIVWMYNALGLRYIMHFFMLSALAGVFFLIAAIFSIIGVSCPNGLVTEIRGLLSQRNCPAVAALVATRSSYLAKLLRAALKNPAMNSFHAWAIMRRTQEYEQAKVRNYIRSFGFVGVLFFLGGLSGFFDGSISSYSIIAKSSTAPKPSRVMRRCWRLLIWMR